MYVLQHTQKILPEGSGMAALGMTKRKVSLSMSSLASSMTDGTTDENGHRHRHAGPYMEGNMNLLATL